MSVSLLYNILIAIVVLCFFALSVLAFIKGDVPVGIALICLGIANGLLVVK